MNAYEFLSRVQKLDRLIECKTEEVKQLREMATQVTQLGDGMPHAFGASDKIGNAVTKIVDAQAETNELVDKLIDCRQEIIDKIEQLPPCQYTVLHRRFVLLHKWREVAEELHYSEMQVHRIKKRAVRNLQKILDEEQSNDVMEC